METIILAHRKQTEDMPSRLFGSSKQAVSRSSQSSKFSLVSISETNIYELPNCSSYSPLIFFFFFGESSFPLLKLNGLHISSVPGQVSKF